MTYTYDINTSKKDTRSTICLSTCHSIHSIVKLFLSTFLVAHIYTPDIFTYAVNVGLYQLMTYAAMMLSYSLFSIWVDKSNRIWCYRIANIFSTALVVITIFYGENLAELVVLAGALNGLGFGAYYSSYNVLKQEMVSRKHMAKMAIVLSVLSRVVNVVFPIVIGAMIKVADFKLVAFFVLGLSVLLFGLTFLIKAKRPADSNFNPIEYLKKLKEDPPFKKRMTFVYVICFFYGLTSILSMMLNINIMIHFGSSFSLGAITSICSLVAVVVLILVTRFTKPGKRAWMFVLGTILPLVGATLFMSLPTKATLVAYYALITIADVVNATILDIYRNKNLKEAGYYQDIAEHQCVVETIFQIVKIVAFGLVILFGSLKNTTVLQVGFVVFVVLYSATSILMLFYEKMQAKRKAMEKASVADLQEDIEVADDNGISIE